jgi:hypothetical protein
MKHDDRGTVEDLKYVFDNFTMPGRTQIPRYDEAARVLPKRNQRPEGIRETGEEPDSGRPRPGPDFTT